MPGNVNTARLSELINQKFDSNVAFAKKCKVSKQYVSEVLSGRIDPSLDRIILFANELDVCVDDLLIRGRD